MTPPPDSAAGAEAPQPGQEPRRFAINDNINAAYYGEMGEVFARQTRDRVHWGAAQSIGDQILDIGCSQGIGCILLGREGCNVLGLDISPTAIDTANRYLATETETVRERVTFACADFMAHDFGNLRFTTIMLGEVLEHLTRPLEFIKRAFDLLEPNGRLVITVPFGINDFPDHKRTYYLTGILSLLNGLFGLRSVHYFGPWIGFCAERLAERVEPGDISLPLADVDRLEQSFFGNERKLRDDAANVAQQLVKIRQQLKAAQEQAAANLQRAVSAEQKTLEADRRSSAADNALAAAEAALAEARGEAAKLQRGLEDSRAAAAESAAALAQTNHALEAVRAETAQIEAAGLEASTKATRLSAELAQANAALDAAQTEASRSKEALAEAQFALHDADSATARISTELAQAREQAEAEAAQHLAALGRSDAALAQAQAARDAANAGLVQARRETETVSRARDAAQQQLALRDKQAVAFEQQGKDSLNRVSRTEQRVRDLERERSLILDSISMKAGRLMVESAGSPAALVRMPRRMWRLYRGAKARQSAELVHNNPTIRENATAAATPAAPLVAAVPRDAILPLSERTTFSRGLVSLEQVKLPQQHFAAGQQTAPFDIKLSGRAGTVELVLNLQGAAAATFTLSVTPLTGKRRQNVAGQAKKLVFAGGTGPQAVVALPVAAETTGLRLVLSMGAQAVTFAPEMGVSFLPRGVSVVIPSYKAVDRIAQCLTSLAAQSLDPAAFEAIVILNGPADGTEEAIAAFRRKQPRLNIRVLKTAPASAGRARNAGIAAAQFDHITLLDDDDTLTPGYLEAMLAEADGNQVVIASIRDVLAGEIRSTPLSTHIEAASGRRAVPVTQLQSLYAMNACKLVPSTTLRQFAFDPALRSAEDVVFWAELAAKMLPGNRMVTAQGAALYLRNLTEDSISRRVSSYAFMITERIAVLTALAKVMASEDCRLPAFVSGQMRSQAKFMHRYLDFNRHEYARAVGDITAAALPGWVLTELNAALAEELVLSFCFPPANDTAGIVAAKRIAMADAPVDALSNRMKTVRQSDPSLSQLTQTRLGRHIETDAPEAFSNWNAIEVFCTKTRKAIDVMTGQRGRPYARLYSRAMWPASHFAAAFQKARQPDLAWSAEFSDPLLRDVKGLERGGALDMQWLKQSGLFDMVAAQGLGHLSTDSLFAWCEILPVALAQELIFTNQNQLDYMLGYQSDDRLRQMMREKATIAPQPTLPERYYAMTAPRYDLSPERINIGYFGSFYQTRGIGELLVALQSLSQAERDRFCLHIFTQDPTQIEKLPEAAVLKGSLRAQGYLSYLEFLSTSRQFDYLYVNDAKCADQHGINPYLPSKLSDYLGTGRKILASVEVGSPMSQTRLPTGSVMLAMEDQDQMVAALRQILQARTA